MTNTTERSTIEALGTKKSWWTNHILPNQVYRLFRHDISAVKIIVDTVDPRIQERVLRGTFEELFTVPPMVEDNHVSITQS